MNDLDKRVTKELNRRNRRETTHFVLDVTWKCAFIGLLFKLIF